MKVKEAIAFLQTQDPETELVMQTDENFGLYGPVTLRPGYKPMRHVKFDEACGSHAVRAYTGNTLAFLRDMFTDVKLLRKAAPVVAVDFLKAADE